MNQEPVGGGDGQADASSTGLDRNVGGLLSYVCGPISGIIFLIIEKKSAFVRFHAMQSTVTFAGLFVIGLITNVLPVLGVLISLLLAPVTLILWIILMYKAFQGERFKLPLVGDWAEQLLSRMEAGSSG